MRCFGLAVSNTNLRRRGVLRDEADALSGNSYPNCMERVESSSILFDPHSYIRGAYTARTGGCYVLFRWTDELEVEEL